MESYNCGVVLWFAFNRKRENGMRIVALLLTVSLTAAIALAQQSVPPPPQPVADKPPAAPPPAVNPPAANPPAANGPTLDATLKFIQEKVNQQGKIVYVETVTDSVTGESASESYPADKRPAAKAGGLARQSAFAAKKGGGGFGGGSSPERSAETQVVAVDPVGGAISLQENGSDSEVVRAGFGMMLPVSSDWTKTWSVYFKNIEKLEVLSSSDYKHRVKPAMTYQDDPTYFELVIHLAPGKSVQRHIQTTPSSGRRGRTVETDDSIQEFALHFRDEDSANRAAKAMIHAIELCGGGSQPELF